MSSSASTGEDSFSSPERSGGSWNPIPESDQVRERESDWPIGPPQQAELPDGEYVAAYRGAERNIWFGQKKIRLCFQIIEPTCYVGIEVFLFATLPNRLSHRHKYYDLWSKANGGPPRRNDRMSPRVFRGYWKVKVGWSVPRTGGHPMPQVVELLERVAGG